MASHRLAQMGRITKKQGLWQGNAAAPPAWQMITSLFVNVPKWHNHGTNIVSPILKKSIKQVGIVYVDDTNLWARSEGDNNPMSAMQKGQKDVNRWGGSLQEVEGTPQPHKCTWTVENMVQDTKEEWVYRDTETKNRKGKEEEEEDEYKKELDSLEMTVLQLMGDAKAIKLLKSSKAVKNLGLFTRPDGCSNRHMRQMKDRMEDWNIQVKNDALPTRSVWTSYNHQLWSDLRYGLGVSSATMKELREGLGSSDYYLISSLGVVRTTKTVWRYLPA